MISIIDDDRPALDSLGFLLECSGLKSRGFASCEAFLADEAPTSGCIVLDIHMPGMSGLELLEELRRRGDKRPVIVVTAHPTQVSLERARAAGALTVLEKPFQATTILPLIRSTLGQTPCSSCD